MSANVTEGHFADIINKDIDVFSKKMREINYTFADDDSIASAEFSV